MYGSPASVSRASTWSRSDVNGLNASTAWPSSWSPWTSSTKRSSLEDGGAPSASTSEASDASGRRRVSMASTRTVDGPTGLL
jgi:hypothetical protein